MAQKTIQQIKDSIFADYEKQFPKERLWGKVFSIYLLDKYARLLYRIYQKANKQE